MRRFRVLVYIGLVSILYRESRTLVELANFAGPTCRGGARRLEDYPGNVFIPVGSEPDRICAGLSRFCELYPDSAISLLNDADFDVTDKAAKLNSVYSLRNSDAEVRAVIYDADSSPTEPLTSCHRCLVSQQSAVYILPKYGGQRWRAQFWSGVAANQTMWSLGYERRMLRRGSLYYLVGHGLMISSQLIQEFPFREFLPGEDVELGYRLSMAEIKPCIAQGLDRCEAVSELSEFLRQNERWFVGEALSLKVLWQARTVAGFRGLVRRVSGLLFWVFGPQFVAFVLIEAIRKGGFPQALLLAAIMTRVVNVMLMRKRISSEVEVNLEIRPIWVVGFVLKPILGSVAGIGILVRIIFRGTEFGVMPGARRV